MNTPVRLTSSLAIISLVSGILGWTLAPLLGSLVAIVTGHLARREIRTDPSLGGDSLAVVGLVLGWVAVLGVLLGIAVVIAFFGGIAMLGLR